MGYGERDWYLSSLPPPKGREQNWFKAMVFLPELPDKIPMYPSGTGVCGNNLTNALSCI